MSKAVKVILVVVFVLIAGTAGYFAVCNINYSDGSRAGYLIKISEKGYVFKTYEGQVNLGGIGDGEVNAIVANNIWDFSVMEDSVYHKMQELQGKHVNLYYKEKIKNFPWQGDTKYFVYKVEPVND